MFSYMLLLSMCCILISKDNLIEFILVIITIRKVAIRLNCIRDKIKLYAKLNSIRLNKCEFLLYD